MTDAPHPARSPEFLSRLHDGELAGAEKIAFDRHVATCRECGEAVADFEASLTAFRTAPTSAPASDLSARILRKIRAQSPSRRPFGVTFGIDLRWAGAAIAALLTVLIGAPILLRREKVGARAPEPISVHLAEKESDQPEAPSANAPPAKQLLKQAPGRENAAPSQSAAAAPAAPRAAQKPAEGGRFASEEKAQSPAAAGQAQARASTALRDLAAASDERAGADSIAPVGAPAAAAEMKRQEPRLSVRPLDGLGEAPAIARAPSEPDLGSLRGQEFVLEVDADGRVREASASRSEPQSLARRKDEAARVSPASPVDPLRELRFAPGDRPRRLLLRVE